MENKKNIYVLMKQNGDVPKSTLQHIVDTLNNELAKQHIAKALAHALDTLIRTSNIYILSYANIDLVCVRSWDTNARTAILNLPFVNQEDHDKSGYDKIQMF